MVLLLIVLELTRHELARVIVEMVGPSGPWSVITGCVQRSP